MSGGLRALRRFTRGAGAARDERCELCAQRLAAAHEHLVVLERRELRCACTPCALLFDAPREGARYLRVRRRVERAPAPSDLVWARLGAPLELAFFYRTGAPPRVVAVFPGAAGPTESEVEPDGWAALLQEAPSLADLAPEVEALLAFRRGDERVALRVSIDRCAALVALVRARWRGLSGGPGLWRALEAFFTELQGEARPCRG